MWYLGGHFDKKIGVVPLFSAVYSNFNGFQAFYNQKKKIDFLNGSKKKVVQNLWELK